jgi:uncharacterized protein YndB with AHSA1/START domain
MTVLMTDIPVRKSITVGAAAPDAFAVFTTEIDTWWPRSHHIGKSPMNAVHIEGRVGGRCYTDHEDGTECDWGRVLVWEPPRRLVLAWQITHDWGFQPDVAMASEVEVIFTSVGREVTRVDLKHQFFERHGAGAESMRKSVDDPNGWTTIFKLYSQRVKAR